MFARRSQPFATARNRSCNPRMAVPMVSSAEGVIFGGFKRRVASFRVAGVALRDAQTCFVTRRFRKISCSFRGMRSTLDVSSGRRSTLDVSSVILRGRHSTLDMSCCVFLRIALAGLRQVATRCRFRGRRGIL